MKQSDCPICRAELNNGLCCGCGYDESGDFLINRTLVPVSELSALERGFCYARKAMRSGAEMSELFSACVNTELFPRKKEDPKKMVASGKAGADLAWTLNAAGTLTISGTGSMDDYNLYSPVQRMPPPWYSERNAIRRVEILAGVTGIGNYAFDECRSLTAVSLPERVKNIGKWAFSGCKSLTDIWLREGLTSVAEGAFSGCGKLEQIVLPAGAARIDKWAFSGCAQLAAVTLPESLKSIEINAFSGCGMIRDVYYGGSEASRGEKETAWEMYGNAPLFHAEWHYMG